MKLVDLYDYVLIELNKLEAPSLLLDDFNYFLNKAIQQYINTVYAKLEIDQQSTDDISFLKNIEIYPKTGESFDIKSLQLPEDYMHLLNCIVEYEIEKCNSTYTKSYPARRLTPDLHSQIINNAYMKPSFDRPYYRLKGKENISIDIGQSNIIPTKVLIEYIKTPGLYKLTHEDLSGGSESELEFPDYVCYEIINIFTRLVMENASDPRLQTNIPLNTTIGNPTQTTS